MGIGTSQPQGQMGAPNGSPNKGAIAGGATASPQTQAQYQQGTFGPQNPQGVMALQNAYQQFQNGAPPQPNPMFGQQPVGNLQGAPLGGGQAQGQLAFNPSTQQAPTLGAQLMGTAPHITPQPPMAVPPGVPGTFSPQQMPGAPMTQQTRPEDPRMAAMRYMQRMKLGGG